MLVQYGIFCIVTEKTANLGHETTVLVNEKNWGRDAVLNDPVVCLNNSLVIPSEICQHRITVNILI